jgi:hypothetical protein
LGVAAVRILYVVTATLEVGGVGCVILGLTGGRRRAEEFQAKKPSRKSRRLSRGTRRSHAPGPEQLVAEVAQEQTHQEQELVAILSGSRAEWIGAFLLVAGVLVGTVANLANT